VRIVLSALLLLASGNIFSNKWQYRITKIEGDRGTDNTRYSSGDPQSMTPYTASMCEMAIMEVDGRGNGKDSQKGNGLVTESLQKVIFS
jgi:hypothetical protein